MASRELVSKRLQIIVFTVVILAGMALFAGFANFNALHEEFLGTNFDSVHSARTLLKAQFFLRQAGERLEDSRIAGVDSQAFRKQAAEALALAAEYGAEGKAGTGSARAELIGRIVKLEAELGQLPSSGSDAAADSKLRALIVEVTSLADAFGVTELEDWGTLSSLNAELARRMGQLRLFIGAMSAIFLGIMAMLARSLIRTRLAEAALKKAKAETEAIQQTTLDASPMGIIYVDPRDLSNRRIVAINRQMTAIFGYPAEALLGLDVSCLYADAEGYRRSTANFEALLAGGGIFRDEILMRRQDGTHVWCAVSGKAIESGGSAQGVVCMLEDISALKRTTEELKDARCQAESASRAKSEFLANMSHEIRTPFTGVLGMLELLLRTRLDSHQREHAELAHGSTKQLLAIVDDILDLSKIESGKLRIEASPTKLPFLLDGIAHFHAMMAGNKKLGFSLEVDADAPDWVLADPVRLRQVLDNLLGNAIKFTTEGKVELQVECLASGGSSRVRFSVTDTGIGIAPEMRERIFDKFIQADTSTARIYGGSGLGLAICRELVEAMGGVIGVDSIEGEGSCFWFEVDLRPAAAPDIIAAPATAAGTIVLPPHTCILLADDNVTSRKVIGEFLRLLAATVVEAGNGERAVALAREVNPDIILMDGQMPVCDGYEATRRIRAVEPAGTRVPIIALTAHAMEADREKCIAAGMDDYLTKPIASELLASRIAMHLQRARSAGGAAIEKKFHGEVLLAEDDLAIQTACRRLLQDLGCHVTVAGNGQEALELGERQDFDLVFLDCRMPILNGWDTARRWRERERARNHPPTAIIAMTAGRYYGEHDSCRAAGMNDVLLKPFNEDSLRLLLEEWLGPRHAQAKTSELAN